jgi:hypothetical protein
MNDRRRRGGGKRAAAPAWAGLLSTQERRHLDTVAREWAGPDLTATGLQAVVEEALNEAATGYDGAGGSDFLVRALLALRARIRQSSRGPQRPAAPT